MNWPAFVENWKDCWRWISMQGAAAITALNTLALSLPPEWAHRIQVATAVLGAATMYGRLIQQSPQQ